MKLRGCLPATTSWLFGVLWFVLAMSEAWQGYWWPHAMVAAVLGALGFLGFYLLRPLSSAPPLTPTGKETP